MVRAWVKLIWNSSGVAAIAAAAQLAIAQALGIIRWDATFDGPSAWSALLTWVAFIYAVAVLGGAAVGRRALRRPTKPDTMPARIAAALSAGLGASIAVGLAWLPAKATRPPVSAHAELLVAMTAGTAIAVSIVVTLVALSVPPVAGGVRAAVAWIWLVGIGSAIAGYLSYRPYSPPRLGVIDAPSLIPVSWYSGPNVMIAMAAILGIAVAAVARWAEAGRLGIAISGFAGPAVVASAYLIAGPGAGEYQLDPYRASLIAVGAGLVASLLVAIPAPGRAVRPTAGADSRQAAPELDRGSTWREAGPREPAGRAESRQPLLDETYEPETYPEEPIPADGRGPYAHGQHEQPEYEPGGYGDQHDQNEYGQSEYGQNEYQQSEYQQSGYEQSQHAAGRAEPAVYLSQAAPTQYEPARPELDQYPAGQPEPTVYTSSQAAPSRYEPARPEPLPEMYPTSQAARHAEPTWQEPDPQPEPSYYQPARQEPSEPVPPPVPQPSPPPVVEEPSPRPAPTMGQPPARSYEEDYSEWLRDLGGGHVPDQRNPTDREDQRH